MGSTKTYGKQKPFDPKLVQNYEDRYALKDVNVHMLNYMVVSLLSK